MVTVVIINNSKNTTKNSDKNGDIYANTIKNNLILQQPKNIEKNKDTSKEEKIDTTNTEKYKCCECYYKDTLDSRCCGLCFYFGDSIYCDKKNKCCYNCISSDISDIWCFNNPNDYFSSGCFLTSSGYGKEPECFCTVFAGIVLCKFALTFPWLLCSMLNGTINCVCGTNKNYLF